MAVCILVAVFVVIVVNEILRSFQRQRLRSEVYKLAEARAAETGKPLLVVGDPYNGIGSGFHGAAYGCGDVCIDLTGCPRCPHARKDELPHGLEDLADDSHVVFISYVLEYVDDYAGCLRELKRVGGNNVFLLRVQPWCLTSLLYPGAKRVIHSDPFKG